MGSFSIWHWLVVLVVVLLFFGAGRLPTVMGDLAKGIKNFKSGMREGEHDQEKAGEPVVPSGTLPRPTTAEAPLRQDETARG